MQVTCKMSFDNVTTHNSGSNIVEHFASEISLQSHFSSEFGFVFHPLYDAQRSQPPKSWSHSYIVPITIPSLDPHCVLILFLFAHLQVCPQVELNVTLPLQAAVASILFTFAMFLPLVSVLPSLYKLDLEALAMMCCLLFPLAFTLL